MFSFKDYLPEELQTKYFDFKPLHYSDEDFCKKILEQIILSNENCKLYRNKLVEKFKFSVPDQLKIQDLSEIPYIPSNIYKKSNNLTITLLKVPLNKIALFSCSSSTTGDPSIVPRTVEDFDQLQYNSIKVFSEFFRWKDLKQNSKRCLVFNFAPNRLTFSLMVRKNLKGFPYLKKTRYFTACMNKPWEYYGHEEYLVKAKFFSTIKAILSTLSIRGAFVLDVSKMLKMINSILKTGYWKEIEVSKIIFGGSPLLMNNMFEKRLLKENRSYDLNGKAIVGCGGGGWDGVKGEAKMGNVDKVKFIKTFEKLFNIKPNEIADIYAFTEGPTLFGGHWSEKYQDFIYHCPDTTRIIVRDQESLEPVNNGESGLLEVITPFGVNGSVNQAVLIDDVVELISNSKCPECSYQGATFRIKGRLENAQGKSCSSLFNWIY